MASHKTLFTALLVLGLTIAAHTQQSAQPTAVRLFPTGRCDGPDGRPRVCFGQGDCGDCPGFQCAGCPGCPGTKFQGSCLGSNIAILCAQPVCDDCKLDQRCSSDNDCTGCGSDVKCRSCPVCPGEKRNGVCKKASAPLACPDIGCASCEDISCSRDSDCTNCGIGYQCNKCPLCGGASPRSGKCQRKGSGQCPVLDCNCDKKGARCTSNADCCESTEICHTCPPCTSSTPVSGQCVARSFHAFVGGRPPLSGRFPTCPPCLPNIDFPSIPSFP